MTIQGKLNRKELEEFADSVWNAKSGWRSNTNQVPWNHAQREVRREWMNTLAAGLRGMDIEVAEEELPPARLVIIVQTALLRYDAEKAALVTRKLGAEVVIDLLDVLAREMAESEDHACDYAEQLDRWIAELKVQTRLLPNTI